MSTIERNTGIVHQDTPSSHTRISQQDCGEPQRYIRTDRTDPHELSRIFTLTPRELDILEIVADGSITSAKKIAQEFSVSESTVKNQITSIYTKLGVHNRLGASFVFVAASDNLEALEDTYAQHAKRMEQSTGISKKEYSPITGVQVSILELRLEGKRRTEIAERLKTTPAAVKLQLAAIYKEFGTLNELTTIMAVSQSGNIILEQHNKIPLGKYSLLSARQIQILDILISDGSLSDKEIATRLHISVSTVRNYFYVINTSLGSNNRVQAGIGYLLWKQSQRDTL
ncbi:hypothetical protein BH11PAT1_BH11PAT1_4340 [soil metagenome]